MSDLIDFVRARLADAERAAPLAAEVMALRPSTAGFGARLLREVERDRRILDEIVPAINRMDDLLETEERGGWHEDSEKLLRLLALPYADHPDYRPEWRP